MINRLATDDAMRESIWQLAMVHHARVGANLCRAWGLSPVLTEVVAHHHDNDPPEASACLVAIVSLAELFALQTDASDESITAIAELPVAAALNLYASDLAAIGARRAKIQESVAELA